MAKNIKKRICIFGDSITYGANDKEMGGWVERLKVFVWNNSDYHVYNQGVSGNTSSDLLKRVKVEIEARNPEIIIVSIGANDSSFRDSLGHEKVALEEFKKNIKTIYEITKEYSNKIMFLGLCDINEDKTDPIPWNTDAHYRKENILEYNEFIKSFCKENDLFFVEILDVVNIDDLEDGLHPNAKGHEKIFQKVKDYLIDKKII